MDERSRNGAGDVTDLPNLPDAESHVEGTASALCHFPLPLTPPPPPREGAWMVGKGWMEGREGGKGGDPGWRGLSHESFRSYGQQE